MPIYEYYCEKCDTKTEVFQKLSDEPLTKCEVCNKKIKKIISAGGFRIYGGGVHKPTTKMD